MERRLSSVVMSGFTFMEIIISLGVLSILVGTITPLATKVHERAEWIETDLEMREIEKGLLSYYRDTGEFPSSGSAHPLDSLIQDSTSLDWEGPYVNLIYDDLTTDSWGSPYTYATIPSGSSAISGWTIVSEMAILASNGANRELETSTYSGSLWYPDAADDNLVRPISSYLMHRDYVKETLNRVDGAMRVASVWRDDYVALLNDLAKGRTDAFRAGESCTPSCPASLTALLNEVATFLGTCRTGESSRIRYKECPIKWLVSQEELSEFYAKDQWGSYLRWHRTNREFYSVGPDKIDDTTSDESSVNYVDSEIPGWY